MEILTLHNRLDLHMHVHMYVMVVCTEFNLGCICQVIVLLAWIWDVSSTRGRSPWKPHSVRIFSSLTLPTQSSLAVVWRSSTTTRKPGSYIRSHSISPVGLFSGTHEFSELVLTRMALLMDQSHLVLPLLSAKVQKFVELWQEKMYTYAFGLCI